jgi:hypothetical protein
MAWGVDLIAMLKNKIKVDNFFLWGFIYDPLGYHSYG